MGVFNRRQKACKGGTSIERPSGADVVVVGASGRNKKINSAVRAPVWRVEGKPTIGAHFETNEWIVVLQKRPWPPGYMHRKMRPSSSAWTRPAGVNSPPHFRISSNEGSFETSATSKVERRVRITTFHSKFQGINGSTGTDLRRGCYWAADDRAAGTWAAPCGWFRKNGRTSPGRIWVVPVCHVSPPSPDQPGRPPPRWAGSAICPAPPEAALASSASGDAPSPPTCTWPKGRRNADVSLPFSSEKMNKTKIILKNFFKFQWNFRLFASESDPRAGWQPLRTVVPSWKVKTFGINKIFLYFVSSWIYILPKVVGTMGGSSSWKGGAHGMCKVGARRLRIMLPRIRAQSS